MIGGSNARLLRIWLVLLALTGGSVLAVSLIGNVAGLVLVLAFALLKARFVIADFMGMSRQSAMRGALLGWCVIPAASVALKLALATIGIG